MRTLAPHQLRFVVGGRTITRDPDGTVTDHTPPREACEQTMRRAAAERHPDSRWFFQRWFGARDRNAEARENWTRQALEGCR